MRQDSVLARHELLKVMPSGMGDPAYAPMLGSFIWKWLGSPLEASARQ